jgi:excisionase family DNA binding protein
MSKLTIKKACELACISRPTIYKYINNGKLSVIKEGNNTFIELSELLRLYPNIPLQQDNDNNVNDLHSLTSEILHKDEIIKMLKQQLEDKQKDNEFLKEQLTQVNGNFAQLNNLLEDKTTKKRKKILGIF